MPKKPASPATINPPEGWKDGEGFGFLHGLNGAGEPIPVVLLRDLSTWYCQVHKLPSKPFGDKLQAIWPTSPLDVYVVRADDYAERHLLTGLDGLREFLSPTPPGICLDSTKAVSVVGYECATHETALQAFERIQDNLAEEKRQEELKPKAVHMPLELNVPKTPPVVERLALSYADAHLVFGWGTVDGVGSAAAVPAFNFSDLFQKLCADRKKNKGDAWTDHQKDGLWAEICKFPARTQGLRAAMAQALGLGDAEAVSKLVRGKKRPKKLEAVTVVKNGKKVS